MNEPHEHCNYCGRRVQEPDPGMCDCSVQVRASWETKHQRERDRLLLAAAALPALIALKYEHAKAARISIGYADALLEELDQKL